MRTQYVTSPPGLLYPKSVKSITVRLITHQYLTTMPSSDTFGNHSSGKASPTRNRSHFPNLIGKVQVRRVNGSIGSEAFVTSTNSWSLLEVLTKNTGRKLLLYDHKYGITPGQSQ